jgi:hypothetical protein
VPRDTVMSEPSCARRRGLAPRGTWQLQSPPLLGGGSGTVVHVVMLESSRAGRWGLAPRDTW